MRRRKLTSTSRSTVGKRCARNGRSDALRWEIVGIVAAAEVVTETVVATKAATNPLIPRMAVLPRLLPAKVAVATRAVCLQVRVKAEAAAASAAVASAVPAEQAAAVRETDSSSAS